jgi:hypothetical protein
VNAGRVIVVGDVHGCIDEFVELMHKVGVVPREDRVVCLGDFLDKGPEPLECLRYAMIRCEAVASNHEERHARWWRRERARAKTGEPNRMRPWHDERDREMNERLTEAEVVWMETRPPWIEIVPGWVAVHGGFKPGVPLAEQDPKKVVRMRWVDAEGDHVPVDYDAAGWKPPEGSVHWTERWSGPESVVYGHEAFNLSEPRVTKSESYGAIHLPHEGYSKAAFGPVQVETWGIDTGCVHGGRLSALVFHPDGRRELAQVSARRVYLEPPHQIPQRLSVLLADKSKDDGS